MRFQPKRRASIDHRPGPNMARAAQKVAIRRKSNRSAGTMTSLPHSMRATRVPTMGVYSPMARRIAAVPRRTDKQVMGIAGLPSRADPALFANAKPTTNRIKMSPIPGQPPAKVEYKRRKMDAPLVYVFIFLRFLYELSPTNRLDPASFEASV
jgi:hypothetical protein